MRILAIETSCDETAVSVVDGRGPIEAPRFTVRSEVVASQIAHHAPWGGVVPNLARREHVRALPPVLLRALGRAGILKKRVRRTRIDKEQKRRVESLLSREGTLAGRVIAMHARYRKPHIDAIAVTCGPGLEPALWVGINFARALSLLWNRPVMCANHMEGHALSALLEQKHKKAYATRTIRYPALALLVSGGHTELVSMTRPLAYRLLGATRDDAAGEAFDKTARLLGLPYPGGPAVSKLAAHAKNSGPFRLPRPMKDTSTLDLSFSGLKTAVLRAARERRLTPVRRAQLAREFEEAVVDVLAAKTRRALDRTRARTFLVGGGVSANRRLREELSELIMREFPDTEFFLPEPGLATDNATMIAIASYMRLRAGAPVPGARTLSARGNLVLRSRGV